MERLTQQLQFIMEVDKLKGVLRQTQLLGVDRRENSAEHSWHVVLAAVILAEYANQTVDVLQVVKMLLIHDVVEIDAGDTFMYLETADAEQTQREQQAADRLFALLPQAQAVEFRALWDEFEARKTPEARYAKALDRLMPMLHNYHTQGFAWRKHQVPAERVYQRNVYMADGSNQLWDYAKNIINLAIERGYLQA